MTDISDVTEIEKIGSSAFAWMENAEGNYLAENITIGQFPVEKAEFSENNGHKSLHLVVDEDTEMWAIKTKDGKQILAIKDEETYLYFAMDEKNGKHLTVIGQEDLNAIMKTEGLLSDKISQSVHVSVDETGKKVDYTHDIESGQDSLVAKMRLTKDDERIASSDISVSTRSGEIESKGYNDGVAIQGKSRILQMGERREDIVFGTKVIEGLALVDDEIWRYQDGKLSLVGVKVEDSQQDNAQSIDIGGKKIVYQPAETMSADDFALRAEPSAWQQEKIFAALGERHYSKDSIDDFVWHTGVRTQVKQDLSAQSQAPSALQSSLSFARDIRFRLRLQQHEGQGQEAQKTTPQKVDKVVTTRFVQKTGEER